MPISSRSRRLSFGLVVGAVAALSALAMPTAASAAEACNPLTTPTAATQPWADFAASPNEFINLEAAYNTFVNAELTFANAIQVGTTQTQFDALSVTAGTATTAAQLQSQTANDAISAQFAALDAGLLAADPGGQAANDAVRQAMADTINASQYAGPLNLAFTDFFSQMATYLADVQTAITASAAVPTIPSGLSTGGATLLGLIDGSGAFFGTVYYDGAAAQVKYGCPALAATGSNDPAPAIGVAGLVMLAGATLLIVAQRRREHAEA